MHVVRLYYDRPKSALLVHHLLYIRNPASSNSSAYMYIAYKPLSPDAELTGILGYYIVSHLKAVQA